MTDIEDLAVGPESAGMMWASQHIRHTVDARRGAAIDGLRAWLFTLIPHPRHRSDLQDRIGALQASRWGDEFRVYRWRSELVTA